LKWLAVRQGLAERVGEITFQIVQAASTRIGKDQSVTRSVN
jgi:hypothetical protein